MATREGLIGRSASILNSRLVSFTALLLYLSPTGPAGLGSVTGLLSRFFSA